MKCLLFYTTAICTSFAFAHSALAERSWDCGGNWACTATLSDDGVMTISGTGDMYDFHDETAPWKSYMSSIMQAVVEEGITSIGVNSFNGARNMTSLSLPNKLTSIGGGALKKTGITTLEIPETVTNIGVYAFGESALSEVNLPSGITVIDQGVFNQSHITSLTLPDGLTTIQYRAFRVTNLEEIVIPDSVTYIDDEAFSACRNLTSITIAPNENLVIDSDAFYEVDAHITIYCAGAAASVCDAKLHAAGYTNLHSVEVPALKKKPKTYTSESGAVVTVDSDGNILKMRGKKIYTVEEAEAATAHGDRFHVGLTYK